MNTEFFIAKRILKGTKDDGRFSRPIVLFATIGIALGIIVMMLSISIVTGFQSEIRNKVIGFGSHIQITNGGSNISYESSPMHRDQPFLNVVEQMPEVKHYQMYAIKPAIVRSKGDSIEQNGRLKLQHDIQGVVVKGVSQDYDWSFFASKMNEGTPPKYRSGVKNDSILISQYLADKLKLELYDKVSTYFVKDSGPKEKKFIVAGIYETGLEDFDKQFLFADLAQLQQLNLWGIKNSILMQDQCINESLVFEATAFSSEKNILHSWNKGPFQPKDRLLLPVTSDTVIQLISGAFTSEDYGPPVLMLDPDTCYLEIKINSNETECLCALGSLMDSEGLNDTTRLYTFEQGTITTIFHEGKGSRQNYIGGYEILLHDYEQVSNAVDLIDEETFALFNVTTIQNLNPEIFGWLEMLDANVYIIIILMIVVAIINMTSALLILILERTNMIGVIKALGGTNSSIQKIFLWNGSFIIGRGILWGNAVALLIIFLQNQFGFIQLAESTYFVKEVPMYFTLDYFLLLNLGTLIICLIALLLPSLFVARITPSRALSFD